ncbi:Serpin (serine protease inhibitor) [Carpediemonas membranifera]|uniref:Serpin (Serine protease inhibitor) n=1 Tax=Carpediemonas membranifera TaxID=201153 RepID=A0A8J6B7Q9_9EUKA|nr:Serpin (serine protease inhibitor) [Carpediemonas membranifera]|eukprot:KAG9396004.1 Serpin (serine protease inhibitor) [Carpediemonas membranifera]
MDAANQLQNKLSQYAFRTDASTCVSGFSLLYTLLLLFTSVDESSPVNSSLSNALSIDSVSLKAFRAVLDSLNASGVHTAATSFIRDFSDRDPVIEALQHRFLDATVQQLTSVDAINQWCAAHTNGAIAQILTQLDPDTAAALVSTLYFKARWVTPFDPTRNVGRPFTLLSGDRVTVDMMRNEDAHVSVWRTETSTGFVGEYKAPATDVLALFSLPNKPGETGLREALAELATGQPELAAQPHAVDLSLPKFRVDQSFQADNFLRQLGLTRQYESFEFAALQHRPMLQVTKTIQKMFLAVDEDGTEAAAVTAMMLDEALVLHDKREPLVFDRPFAFALVDRSGTRLLTAAIVNPAAE